MNSIYQPFRFLINDRITAAPSNRFDLDSVCVDFAISPDVGFNFSPCLITLLFFNSSYIDFEVL